jgi:hypothetical protein
MSGEGRKPKGTCPANCGSQEIRKSGEHWVLLDGGKRVCTNPWHIGGDERLAQLSRWFRNWSPR